MCNNNMRFYIETSRDKKKFASTQESFDFMCYGILANILQNQYRNRAKQWTCCLELYLSGKMMIQLISNKKTEARVVTIEENGQQMEANH